MELQHHLPPSLFPVLCCLRLAPPLLLLLLFLAPGPPSQALAVALGGSLATRPHSSCCQMCSPKATNTVARPHIEGGIKNETSVSSLDSGRFYTSNEKTFAPYMRGVFRMWSPGAQDGQRVLRKGVPWSVGLFFKSPSRVGTNHAPRIGEGDTFIGPQSPTQLQEDGQFLEVPVFLPAHFPTSPPASTERPTWPPRREP